MARIAFTRKNIMFRLSLLFIASTFVMGCAQGPKEFFANAWESSRDGAANIAHKMPWKKSKDEEKDVIADNDEEETNGIQNVSMEEAEDKTGSIFSAWVRKGSNEEKTTADPFLNQSWVKNAKNKSAKKKRNKIRHVSRETVDDYPAIIKDETKSDKNKSELDLLLNSIESGNNTQESIKKNEFVDGIDLNLNELRASLKKDTDSNNEIVIPDLDDTKSMDIVEKKMILAETFLVKGDIKSAKEKALEAQNIIDKENLAYNDNSPEDFLKRINQKEDSVPELTIPDAPSDEFAFNDKPVSIPEKNIAKKKSRFNLAFPHASSTDEWKSEPTQTNKTKATKFQNFNQSSQPKSSSNKSMIVDTESLSERDYIREEFKKSKKEKRKNSVNSSEESWDTSATKQGLINAEKLTQSTKKPFFSTQTEIGKVRANSHTEIKLASHEKNLIAPMGNMKVHHNLKNNISNNVDVKSNQLETIDFDDDLLNAPAEEIALAPIGEDFPIDKNSSLSRNIGSTAYLISVGLFLFGFTLIIRRKLRKNKIAA